MPKWYEPKYRVQCYYFDDEVAGVMGMPGGWTHGEFYTLRGARKAKAWLDHRLANSEALIEWID